MDDSSLKVETVPEDADSVVVKITGAANITTVSMLLMKLLDAFELASHVTIDLSGITEIDAAGLLLFCSSHRSSIYIDKGFRIIGQDQPAILKAAMASGHLRTTGCAIDMQHTCIWPGKETITAKPIMAAGDPIMPTISSRQVDHGERVPRAA